ncbi:hypothetical protein F5Y07DRAFT_371795 [Xylaria sp. FL0933]|nr:hypothetical protein F5Y07DRAFT_371795 [Xylaria sp. FL0933]
MNAMDTSLMVYHTRGSPVHEYSCSFSLEPESHRHQTEAILPSNGSLTTLSSLGHQAAALNTLARFLCTTKDALNNIFGALALDNTFVSTFSIPRPLSVGLGNGERAATTPPEAGRYHCVTQPRASNCAHLRVGDADHTHIPRWTKGSIVKYVICNESFDDSDLAGIVAQKMHEATSMWDNIGVKFEYTRRRNKASFQVKYCDMPDDEDSRVYAQSFFPQEKAGKLSIYKLALEDANIKYLANILAHEIGHILGLRHEFRETWKSVRWGKKNERSVMNYFMHLNQYSVQKQDLRDLKSFYDSTKRTHKRLPIRDFNPPACTFFH